MLTAALVVAITAKHSSLNTSEIETKGGKESTDNHKISHVGTLICFSMLLFKYFTVIIYQLLKFGCQYGLDKTSRSGLDS